MCEKIFYCFCSVAKFRFFRALFDELLCEETRGKNVQVQGDEKNEREKTVADSVYAPARRFMLKTSN